MRHRCGEGEEIDERLDRIDERLDRQAARLEQLTEDVDFLLAAQPPPMVGDAVALTITATPIQPQS